MWRWSLQTVRSAISRHHIPSHLPQRSKLERAQFERTRDDDLVFKPLPSQRTSSPDTPSVGAKSQNELGAVNQDDTKPISHAGGSVSRRTPRVVDKSGILAVAQVRTASANEHNTVLVLKQFLTGSLDTSSSVKKSKLCDVNALYHSLKRRNLLHLLSNEDFSVLVALFGTNLLLPRSLTRLHSDSQTADQDNSHPFIPHRVQQITQYMVEDQPRPYWTTVVEIATDKERLKRRLSNLDRYWLMRAHLAEVSVYAASIKASEVSVNDARVAYPLRQARTHYEYLVYSGHRHRHIQLPFLRTLVSLGLTSEVVSRLVEVLRTSDQVHRELQTFVWEFILDHGHEFSAETNKNLMDSITKSLYAAMPASTSKSKSSAVSPVPSARVERVFTIREIVTILSTRLFCRNTKGIPLPMWDWATSTLRRALIQPTSIEEVYGNFYLLAIINAPPTSPRNRSMPLSSASDWRVICALAALERVVDPDQTRSATHLSDTLAENIKPLLMEFWKLFHTGRVECPPVVHTAILSSFCYLAGRTKCSQLLDECLPAVFRTSEQSGLARATTALRHLVAEHTIAQILCGEDFRQSIHRLSQCFPDSRSDQGEAVSQVILRLCDTHPLLAIRMHGYAYNLQMPTGAEVCRSLGIVAAQEGDFRLALEYIAEKQLVHRQRAEILEAIAATVASLGFVRGDIADKLTTNMMRIFRKKPPTESSREDVQQTILLFLEAGLHPQAGLIVSTIHASHPAYFSSTFVDIFLRKLVYRRQFRISIAIFRTLLPHYQSYAPRWYHLLLERLNKADARNMLARLRRLRSQVPGYDVWLHRIYGGVRTTRIRTRNIAKLATSKTIPMQYHGRLLPLLLRTRRPRRYASKMLYYTHQNDYDVKTRTVMGNTLIHSILRSKTSSRKAQLRILLASLNQLQSNSAFVPDRITFHIMIKGIIRLDRVVDYRGVRALFDRIIRSGYPTGDVVAPGEPVFDAEHISLIERVDFPQLESKIEFKRHVRPLYRMFATALYTRKDIYGGRRVVKILKAVKAEMAKEVQNNDPS